jgi:lipoprotein-anchoring transpeptidase ErfK/SrfK
VFDYRFSMVTRFGMLAAFALSAAVLGAAGVPANAAEAVAVKGYGTRTIVIRLSERKLYYVDGSGRTVSYAVGVGRAGKLWIGKSFISDKRIKPAWSPPDEIRRDRPGIPDVIPAGAPSNPMGAAALLIAGTEYAIHGTNNPGSIGGFVSYGCIRMHNRDVLDLFARVDVGTPVVVVR